MPRRTWTDDELRVAVRQARTWREVKDVLGLSDGGGTRATIRRHAERLELDISHLPDVRSRRGLRRFGDDDLRAAVRESNTMADVMRKLGYEPSGGIHRFLVGHVARFGIDTSHFVGRSWARGRVFPGRKQRSLQDLLVVGSSVNGSRLVSRLVAAGLKDHRCECCNHAEWNGQPIPLELDHVNGDHTDNRLENLQVLCPNCHAQTPTYCGRNRGRVVELADTAVLEAAASA